MAGPGYWLRSFVYRCLRQCGVVHELCEAPRLRAVCRVPHYPGRSGSLLGVAIGGIVAAGSKLAILRYLQAPTLKVFVVSRPPFGIISSFAGSPSGIAIAPAPAAALSLPQKLRRTSCAS